MMAAALTQLVTKDHTFGQGPPPFTEYLIEVNTVPINLGASPDSPDAVDEASDIRRPLTGAERAAIESAISEYGPVRWIENPSDWQSPSLTPVVEGSAILGVDAPRFGRGVGFVSVSLWCGGVCGTWLTYRLVFSDGAWRVVGIEGPIAIS